QKKIDSMKRKACRLRKQIEATDGFIFKSEIKQHIFLHLLEELETGKESVFNSGITHKQLLREFFIKKCIQLLCSVLNQQQIPSFYADITANIASIFFTVEMDRDNCIELAKKI